MWSFAKEEKIMRFLVREEIRTEHVEELMRLFDKALEAERNKKRDIPKS
jgi:hypothetical protein